MSLGLVAFLRARIDEDEQAARAATPGRWEKAWGEVRIGDTWTRLDHEKQRDTDGDAAHIVRQDPARVLREVDAKRELLKLHAPRESGDGCVVCDDGNDSCGCLSGPSWSYPCNTVKFLALPYADHPDYLEQWRP